MSDRSGEPECPIPDVNVLVAVTNTSHQHHTQAREWLNRVDRFATTPITENGLVRILLNPAVLGQEISGEYATGVLAGIRADSRATFIPDGSSLADARVDLIGLAGHKQTTDFHLINLAAHHDAVLVTFDQKIRRALTTVDQKYVRTLA